MIYVLALFLRVLSLDWAGLFFEVHFGELYRDVANLGSFRLTNSSYIELKLSIYLRESNVSKYFTPQSFVFVERALLLMLFTLSRIGRLSGSLV